jgi:hypothetical protein
MLSVKKTIVLGIVLWIGLGLTVQAASGPGLPGSDRRDDVAYAQALYRSLLGREPSPSELAATVRDLQAAPYRVVVHSRLLDSSEFKQRVDDATFLVGLYDQLRQREPLIHQMIIGLYYLKEGVPRSTVFGSLVQPQLPVKAVTPELAQRYDSLLLDFKPQTLGRYRQTAQRYTALDPKTQRARLLEEAIQLDGAEPGLPAPEFHEASPEPDPEFNVYYGYLHAHSSLSLDALLLGSPGPFAAYDYARNVAGLDFLGLSDHAEFISLWPWFDAWKVLQAAADAYNKDGTFVALRGFEYTNPIYGHLNVFDTPDFVATWSALTLRQFYTWLSRYPDAVATFNHPGDYDFLHLEFKHFTYFSAVGHQVMGIELLTHGANYGQYSVGYNPDDGLGYLDEANHAGWHIASVSAQDNHSGGWGTIDDYRTAVLAPALTRADILEALQHRRFYSTQDKNLVMSFRTDGHEMGSFVGPGEKTFTVTLSDGNGEGFAAIDFYANGHLSESRAVSSSGSWDFAVTARADDYYYALVTQADGDQAMSAPIWVQGMSDQ